MDGDYAASIQILRRGLSTVGHTGTYAWGDLPSWSVGSSNLLANGESPNQESPSTGVVGRGVSIDEFYYNNNSDRN